MDVEEILKTKAGTDEGAHALLSQACNIQKLKHKTNECLFSAEEELLIKLCCKYDPSSSLQLLGFRQDKFNEWLLEHENRFAQK